MGAIKQQLQKVQMNRHTGTNRVSMGQSAGTLLAAYLLQSSGVHKVPKAVCIYRKYGMSAGFAPTAFLQTRRSSPTCLWLLRKPWALTAFACVGLDSALRRLVSNWAGRCPDVLKASLNPCGLSV